MRITRRTVIVGGASLGAVAAVGGCTPGGKVSGKTTDTGDTAGPATPERAVEPAPWEPDGTVDEAAFAWGVQTGDTTASAVIVSVRTTEAELVVVVAEGGESWTEVTRVEALIPEDGVVQLELDGLAADTVYAVVAYAADGRRSRVARVRTALPADGWRVVTFGATSCLRGNQPWPSLTMAAAEQLDFFCLLGDTIYADYEPDIFDYEAKWSTALSTEGLRAVTASTSIIATWDDHEVSNNYDLAADGTDVHYAAGYAAFRRGIPWRNGPGGTQIWRTLSWGDVLDVFVLDTRGERRDGRICSREQMDWFKAAITASTARFKIVLNSVPITDLNILFGTLQEQDRWSGFPEDRAELLEHIRDSGVTGVLWVTGDLHYAQAGHVDPTGGVAYDQWEVLAGPGGSPKNALVEAFVGDAQLPVVFANWNYARFRCDPGTGEITLTFIGDDGATLAETTLTF